MERTHVLAVAIVNSMGLTNGEDPRCVPPDFKVSPWTEYYFLAFGFLHSVRSEFTDDVSEPARLVIHMTGEDGIHSVTHSGFRNFVSKFAPHTVQKPQNQ